MTVPVEPAPPSQPPIPEARPVSSLLVRILLRLLAVLSLCTGIAGIFIPGLPTTVFILIAGWAAARSSPRLHAWLWRHRLFGPMLRNWADGGRVSRRAKWSATAAMAVCAVVLLWLPTPLWVRVLSLGCMACVLLWLWLRPEPPVGARA